MYRYPSRCFPQPDSAGKTPFSVGTCREDTVSDRKMPGNGSRNPLNGSGDRICAVSFGSRQNPINPAAGSVQRIPASIFHRFPVPSCRIRPVFRDLGWWSQLVSLAFFSFSKKKIEIISCIFSRLWHQIVTRWFLCKMVLLLIMRVRCENGLSKSSLRAGLVGEVPSIGQQGRPILHLQTFSYGGISKKSSIKTKLKIYRTSSKQLCLHLGRSILIFVRRFANWCLKDSSDVLKLMDIILSISNDLFFNFSLSTSL